MKSLQEYILENVDNEINEGNIWNSIKNWFKKLFEPSDRQFDRWNPDNKISGENLERYTQYIENTFNSKFIKFTKILKKDLKQFVYPNNIEPNEDGEIGFYKFIDNVNKEKDKTKYFGYIYDDKKEVKDIIALINCNFVNNQIEILNIQIIKEFINVFSLKKLINQIIKEKDFILSSNSIFVKQSVNKELYNQLINDCEFNKEYNQELNENIAIFNIQ